jgi:hypothetical protein
MMLNIAIDLYHTVIKAQCRKSLITKPVETEHLFIPNTIFGPKEVKYRQL